MISEQILKNAFASLDWENLKNHFEDIKLKRSEFSVFCGHFRRYTDLICKHSNKKFIQNRTSFFNEISTFVLEHLGAESKAEFDAEIELIDQIEKGYQGIINTLSKCDIGKHPATVRSAGIIKRASHEYLELNRLLHKKLAATKQFNAMSGPFVQDANGGAISADAVLEGLSDTVAMALIMEAYNNRWFDGETVILPEFPEIDEEVIIQSGSTQVLALIWRQWQRTEKRRRYLGGEFIVLSKDKLPPKVPNNIERLVKYVPADDGFSDREIYDYISNIRLKDRLIQNFFELEIEHRLSEKGVGINNGAALPPKELISGEEAHACISLSEILGYQIADDDERPGGLRLLEWVRGYTVLKELSSHNQGEDVSVEQCTPVFEENELVAILNKCGLEGELANMFISHTCLHKSCRDMFDCPIIRLGESHLLLFTPAVTNINIPMVVLSNLSNRGEVLGRKGKAFEKYIHGYLGKQRMEAFSFKATREGQEYEYDVVLPWEGHIFIFECKNRSLSGNDPVQSYYFDLEVASQVKQVRRLAEALHKYPDIIEHNMGAQYMGHKVIPCILHSLPYSRSGNIEGVYFTDASSLKRFFDQPYFRIKIPHRIGDSTILHRTAIKKFWNGEKPEAQDYINQLENPFQIELSAKHLDSNTMCFPLSETDLALTVEVVRSEMSVNSVCKAMGANADKVLQEIDKISHQVRETRKAIGERAKNKALE